MELCKLHGLPRTKLPCESVGSTMNPHDLENRPHGPQAHSLGTGLGSLNDYAEMKEDRGKTAVTPVHSERLLETHIQAAVACAKHYVLSVRLFPAPSLGLG